jgi:putative ABC transport system permease protein
MPRSSKGTRSLFQDIRYAMRLMAGSPGYALIIVFVLALGIGATSLVFSLVNSIILSPLPYKDASRLVMVHGIYHEDIDPPTSPPDFLDWKEQNHVFEQVAAYATTRFNINGVDRPESVQGAIVSYNLFNMLGVDPIAGQAPKPEDDKPGAGEGILISYGLWQRMFGIDRGVLGKTLVVNGTSRTVIGVTPPGFAFPKGVDMWVPIGFDPQNAVRTNHFLHVIGRLKPDVGLKQAQAEMNVIAAALEDKYPDTNRGRGTHLALLYDDVLGDAHLALLVLFGAVCFVLLIACANIANLMLAKASGREKEMALRLALGAGPGRLVQQLLTESIVLSTLGGVLGLLLTSLGIQAIIKINPSGLPRLQEVGLDWRVLAMTLFVSVLTGVLFGLAPALQSSKPDLNVALKEGSRGTTTDKNFFRSGLVVVEIALALILLTGASLLIKSFLRLQSIDPGFRPQGTLTVGLFLPPAKYRSGDKMVSFFRDLNAGLATRPEVDSVGAVSVLPLSGSDDRLHFTVDGAPLLAPADRPIAQIRSTIGDYFRAQGIPVLDGRAFTEKDTKDSPSVAIVNNSLAATFFPGESPIGKRITLQFESAPREIVGEVGDVKVDALDVGVRPQIYLPVTQNVSPYMSFVLRGASTSVDLRPTIRIAVNAIDSDQPISDIRRMDELLSSSLSQQRFSTLVMTFLAGLAAVLAAIGIYGVMAYSVSKRSGEIGIRMAMGAQPDDVIKLILRRGIALTAMGIVAGLAGSLALLGVISSLLYNVRVTDPSVFLIVTLGAAGVAILACYIPARKATRVDPIVALRQR